MPPDRSPTAVLTPVATATVPSPATPTRTASIEAPRHIVLEPGEPVTTIGALFYVDLETGTTEGWELGLDSVATAVISPDGRYILFSQYLVDRRLYRKQLLDTTTGAVCELEGTSPWAGAFSPDGRYLLVETAAGIEKLTASTCGREREALGGPFAGWLGGTWLHGSAAWSPDGEALVIWVYSNPTPDEPRGGQHVYLVSPALDGPTKVEVGDGQRSSSPVAWSPDGSRFALASGTSLAVVDQRGQQLWSTDIPGSSVANARWSPDGASVAAHAFPLDVEIEGHVYPGPNPAVYVLDAATGAIRFRLWGASACWGEVWTADGGSLIFVGKLGGDYGRFVVDADGTSVRRLDAADGAFFVEASPTDPNVAAFLRRPRDPDEAVAAVEATLMAVDPDSGQAAPVVEISLEYGLPGWDPVHSPRRWLYDGRLVLFTGDGGHGGCEMGPKRPELEVQFPPFEDGQ